MKQTLLPVAMICLYLLGFSGGYIYGQLKETNQEYHYEELQLGSKSYLCRIKE